MGSDYYLENLYNHHCDEDAGFSKGIREGFDRAIRVSLQEGASQKVIKALEKARKDIE
jgi:hypothetical protein